MFYEENQHFQNIHNGNVKVSKGNRITGFEMGGVTIDENENYQLVRITIDTLNDTITEDKEQYKYTGQSPHSLAYAYYTNNYSRQIISK